MTHRATIVLAGLLAALSFRPVHAQTFAIDRGVWQLSGSAGLSSYSSGDPSTVSFSLSPWAGYFVRRGVEVSIGIPLSYTVVSGGHRSIYGFAAGVAFYLGGPTRHVFPYVSVSGGPRWAHSNFFSDGLGIRVVSTVRAWQVTGAIGLASMIARNFALTSELYYSRSWSSNTYGTSGATGTVRSRAFGLRFGIAAFVF